VEIRVAPRSIVIGALMVVGLVWSLRRAFAPDRQRGLPKPKDLEKALAAHVRERRICAALGSGYGLGETCRISFAVEQREPAYCTETTVGKSLCLRTVAREGDWALCREIVTPLERGFCWFGAAAALERDLCDEAADVAAYKKACRAMPTSIECEVVEKLGDSLKKGCEAARRRDVDACVTGDQQLDAACVAAIAWARHRPPLCDRLPSQFVQRCREEASIAKYDDACVTSDPFCAARSAAEHRDRAACRAFAQPGRDACIASYAFHASYPEACRDIENEKIREACLAQR
jgi:hypothetical protein